MTAQTEPGTGELSNWPLRCDIRSCNTPLIPNHKRCPRLGFVIHSVAYIAFSTTRGASRPRCVFLVRTAARLSEGNTNKCKQSYTKREFAQLPRPRTWARTDATARPWHLVSFGVAKEVYPANLLRRGMAHCPLPTPPSDYVLIFSQPHIQTTRRTYLELLWNDGFEGTVLFLKG